jgi:hypothetical protein
MKKLLCFTALAVIVMAMPAKAAFVPFTGDDPDCKGNVCDLDLVAAKNVTSGNGDVGGQSTGVLVGFNTNPTKVDINISNGYADIKPTVKNTDITQLNFFPTTGEKFTDFSFRGPNDKLDFTKISVTDNFGTVFTDTFGVGFGDFTRIGMIVDGKKPGEYLSSVTITGSLDDVRQIQFSGNAALDPVPLPGALPLFVGGLTGLGILSRRKRQTVFPL